MRGVEPVEGRGRKRLDLGRVGDVAFEPHRIHTALAQFSYCERERAGLDVGECDAHTAVGEDVGERSADTTRASGDGADLASEVVHAVVLLSQGVSTDGGRRAEVRPYRTRRKRSELHVPGFVSYPRSATCRGVSPPTTVTRCRL